MVERLATSFPGSLDSLTNPEGTDSLSNPSHSDQHKNANDSIEAIQLKIGVDNSTDVNSLDYLVRTASTGSESLGVDGNNSLNITAIENTTTLDEVDGSIWGTLKYVIQLTYNNFYYITEMALFDSSSGIDYVQSNIITNSEANLANIAFTKNGSIISLVITPTNASVNARFYRTSLKK